jgi:hypothetical protein
VVTIWKREAIFCTIPSFSRRSREAIYSNIPGAERLPVRTPMSRDERNPPFSGSGLRRSAPIPRRRTSTFREVPRRSRSSGPPFIRILQVDRMKQGVGGSGSGPVWGSVPENSYNGARSVAGLGVGRDGKKGVWGGGG